MKWKSYTLAAYALLLFIGGMIGFAKAHSLPSLLMGITFTVLLLICAWGMAKNCKWSLFGGRILTWFLTLFFCYRFFISFKMMPAGLMALASLIIACLLTFSQEKQLNFDEKH